MQAHKIQVDAKIFIGVLRPRAAYQEMDLVNFRQELYVCLRVFRMLMCV
jgi:hypothetical protein